MDIQKLFDGINYLLNQIFGSAVPPWLPKTIAITLAILLGLWGTLFVIAKIKDLITIEFLPLFYSADEKRRSIRRRRFAKYIEDEIIRLGRQEEWSDYRFAELEAEVEAEGYWKVSSWLFPFGQNRNELRREKTLSKALERSSERLILLEGDPDSGKSIALRHLSERLAHRASNARSTKNLIPIYINLKGLEREKDQEVNLQYIYDYVLQILNWANDRDIDEFLDQEFKIGLENGTWLFLFDSFDEIPEILSSVDADKVINDYSDAISDFLHGMNQCRGIIASRQFRGPSRSNWPRFRILPLTEVRQRQLIHHTELPSEKEKRLLGELGNARDEVRYMVANPMFLGLLSEYMRLNSSLPESIHLVFENYVNARLKRDKERLDKRFGLSAERIRSVAEYVAFCMTADVGLGLTPSRKKLYEAMSRKGFDVDKNLYLILNALEYLKLARSETPEFSDDARTFTFSHRRFQEYFATCVVLRSPSLIDAHELLTNARWRETAVTLLQTQPLESLSPIISLSDELLSNSLATLSNLVENPLEALRKDQEEQNRETAPDFFNWPQGVLHLLGLLQDGLASKLDELHESIKLKASRILVTATLAGTLLDQKWGLEVSGVLPTGIQIGLLERAFEQKSPMLNSIAYRQASKSVQVTSKITKGIRGFLANLYVEGTFWQERYTTFAYINRLPDPKLFLRLYQILLWIPFSTLIWFLFGIGITLIFQPNYLPAVFILFSLWTLGLFLKSLVSAK